MRQDITTIQRASFTPSYFENDGMRTRYDPAAKEDRRETRHSGK